MKHEERVEHEEIVAARRAAESAVADMSEGPLKVTAFQTILAQLLQRQSRGVDFRSTPSRATERTKKTVARVPQGTTSRLMGLLAEGFFTKPRSLAEVRQVLAEKGWHYSLMDLGTPLTRLVRRKQLRRAQVAESGKKTWRYSIH